MLRLICVFVVSNGINRFVYVSYFSLFFSMLERQLDGILREEEKQTPLWLPPSDQYRYAFNAIMASSL